MAVVVVKLVLLDLSHLSGLTRILAFIVAAVLIRRYLIDSRSWSDLRRGPARTPVRAFAGMRLTHVARMNRDLCFALPTLTL